MRISDWSSDVCSSDPNQELIFSSALEAGKRTKGVRGGLEPRAALDILLEGSGLRVEGGSVLTLRPSGGAEASAVRRQTASAVRPALASGSCRERVWPCV